MRTLISSLLVIAHFTFTLSAPTPTVTDENPRVTSRDIMNDMITSTVSAVESIMDMKSTQLPSTLEKSPTTIDDDLFTTMSAQSIQKTTPMADEKIIGSTRLPEMTSSTQTFKDNEAIKIHENHESATTRVQSTVMDQDFSTMTATTVELLATSEMNNKNKSISFDSSTVTAIPITSNVDKDSVQSTIEMPISADTKSDKGKLQKSKLKDTKKKILNEAKTVGKSWIHKQELQKIKQQKPLMDINYSTSATPSMYETATAISTSIKTVPTTIKSTTLTSTMEMVTAPTTEIPIPVTLNANEMKTSVTADVHVNNNNKDNVIVLNSNSSGLIVVDVMESFGKENSTNSFEIKMDLIDDGSDTTTVSNDNKDEIFTVSTSSTTSISSQVEKNEKISTTTSNDDIILVNEGGNSETATSSSAISHGIKWNEVKHNEGNGDIKITFDNIDLPHQNVNVSIENGELIIDSIDISVLNRAEEELRKKAANLTEKSKTNSVGNKTSSLEIVLIEDSGQEEVTTKDNIEENNNNNSATTTQSDNSMNDDVGSTAVRKTTSDDDESRPATIHFELPSVKHKNIEMSNGGSGDDIKIKTTDKDSDTIFYISNTEVKLIESIPTLSPNDTQERKKYPAIYEEDVIVDVPSTTVIVKNRTLNEYPMRRPAIDKYEEDIVLSPLTSDFDPKDINYIGEAFLDVEESSNNGGFSENRHIIPLTSDVVVQPVELKDMPSINIPIIGEPPQIELEDLMFSEDYENGQNNRPPSGYHVEYSPFAVNGRLVKNELHVDEQRDLETTNGTLLSSSLNRTHSISVNTVINGTNMTTVASPYTNVTAAITLDSEDIDSTGL